MLEQLVCLKGSKPDFLVYPSWMFAERTQNSEMKDYYSFEDIF